MGLFIGIIFGSIVMYFGKDYFNEWVVGPLGDFIYNKWMK